MNCKNWTQIIVIIIIIIIIITYRQVINPFKQWKNATPFIKLAESLRFKNNPFNIQRSSLWERGLKHLNPAHAERERERELFFKINLYIIITPD